MLLRAAIPADWRARLPGERAGPRYERIRDLLSSPLTIWIQVVATGPPSHARKLAPMKVALGDLYLRAIR
eukprot:123394-Pyramimonas_sp.AAC.1